jgi:hypothetical protein
LIKGIAIPYSEKFANIMKDKGLVIDLLIKKEKPIESADDSSEASACDADFVGGMLNVIEDSESVH